MHYLSLNKIAKPLIFILKTSFSIKLFKNFFIVFIVENSEVKDGNGGGIASKTNQILGKSNNIKKLLRAKNL